MVSSKKIKIIYIAGYSRSGTTLVDNVLGQIPGFFTIGEGWYIWRRGLLHNCYCGCRLRFRKCQFWNRVFQEAFTDIDNPEARKMADYFRPISKYQLEMLLNKHSEELSQVTKNIEKFYRAVSKVSKCNVIIDSSKWASYGRLLSTISSFDVRQIYMVRDPRGVAFSWKRKKKYEPFADSDFYYKRYNVFRSAAEWLIWNTSIEFLRKLDKQKYYFFRYEDFVKVSHKEIKKILEFAGESERKIPIKNGRIVLGKNHCIAGSPLRFRRGETEIKFDDEWKEKMNWINKTIMTFLTLPYMLYYRYLS
jgi:hypothetical protein